MTLGVRESCRAVMEGARHVRIDSGAIGRLADRIGIGGISAQPAWDSRLNIQGNVDRVANYVLALDSLNFCFWAFPGETRWKVEFDGRTYDGYWALAAALTRAVSDGFDLTDAAVMVAVTEDDLRRVFVGAGEIPLLADRVRNLREAGQILLQRYEGQMTHLVAACQESAERLAQRVVAEFQSFDDRAQLDGIDVRFYKRAQILVVDLASAGVGLFSDLETLTAFADYKVPQVLRELGVLEYDGDLAAAITRQEHLPAGSRAEIEIRSATVVAVCDLREALRAKGQPTTEAELDGVLWHFGQDLEFQQPYHRTRTIFY